MDDLFILTGWSAHQENNIGFSYYHALSSDSYTNHFYLVWQLDMSKQKTVFVFVAFEHELLCYMCLVNVLN